MLIPVAIGVIAMVAYFVWVCLEMAGDTEGGRSLLIGIFGAAAAGVIAALAGLPWRR